MKNLYIILTLLVILFISSCSTSIQPLIKSPGKASDSPSNASAASGSSSNAEAKSIAAASAADSGSFPAVSGAKASKTTPAVNPELEKMYDTAYNQFFSDKRSDAVKTADAILKKDPKNYKALNIKGIALCYLNNYADAMKNIDQALQIAPDYGYARFNKALTYEYNGQYDNALIWYDKDLEIENYVWSYYGKASIYGRRNDIQNTVKNLKAAINIDPSVKNEARKEKDFDPVRKSQEFIDLISAKNVPILYYHAVSDKTWGLSELFATPKDFNNQMEYLKNNNYDVITFDDLKSLNNYKKPVIITFDDGYDNNYTEVYPVLKKYGFKAVVFLPINFIDKGNYLKTSQIKEMSDLISFQSHTVSHADLKALNDKQLQFELSEPITDLEKITGKKPDVLAYPSGSYNQKVIDSVKKYYSYAVTNKGGMFNSESGNYEIKRLYIPRNLTITSFEKKLKNGSL